MKKIFGIFSLVSLSLWTCPAFSKQHTPTIVGGEDATPHSLPFIVSLQKNGRHFCGGSVISKNTVITAAHCAQGQRAEDVTVSLGRHNLKAEEDTKQNIKVKEFVIHPDFSYSTLKNDVAIIHLENPIELNQFIQPINLPEANTIPEGTTLIAGWGNLKECWFCTPPNILQHAKVDVVDFDKCVENYKDFGTGVVEGMMCASSLGIDSCQGDSGGPLVQDGKLLGLTSWGKGCAREGYPGVYTRVSHYIDFIKENMLD